MKQERRGMNLSNLKTSPLQPNPIPIHATLQHAAAHKKARMRGHDRNQDWASGHLWIISELYQAYSWRKSKERDWAEMIGPGGMLLMPGSTPSPNPPPCMPTICLKTPSQLTQGQGLGSTLIDGSTLHRSPQVGSPTGPPSLCPPSSPFCLPPTFPRPPKPPHHLNLSSTGAAYWACSAVSLGHCDSHTSLASSFSTQMCLTIQH